MKFEVIKNGFMAVKDAFVAGAKMIGAAFMKAGWLTLAKAGIVAGSAAAVAYLVIKALKEKKAAALKDENKPAIERSLSEEYYNPIKQETLHKKMKPVKKELQRELRVRPYRMNHSRKKNQKLGKHVIPLCHDIFENGYYGKAHEESPWYMTPWEQYEILVKNWDKMKEVRGSGKEHFDKYYLRRGFI